MPSYSQQRSPRPELVRTISYPRSMHGTRMVHGRVPSRSFARWKLIAGAVAIVGSAVWLTVPFSGDTNHTAAKSIQTPVEPQQEVIKKIDFTTMGAEINAVLAENPRYETGVAVIDLKTGDAATYGAPEPFVAASTAKLLTAIAYLRDVDQGKHTLTEMVGSRNAQTALEALIVESDNVAWDAFNNGILGHAELSAVAQQIGLENYNADKNTITTISVAKLLQALYKESVLSTENTKLLLGYMQRAKEVEYISSIVPAGVKFYHKPGYLNDRVHDATIIDNGSRPYVLVIFSKSKTKYYDQTVGKTMFEQISRSTFKTFFQSTN